MSTQLYTPSRSDALHGCNGMEGSGHPHCLLLHGWDSVHRNKRIPQSIIMLTRVPSSIIGTISHADLIRTWRATEGKAMCRPSALWPTASLPS